MPRRGLWSEGELVSCWRERRGFMTRNGDLVYDNLQPV